MKIGFIGNMNNMPFILASALRDMGHNIVFLLNEERELCRPYNMFPELHKIPSSWIVDLGRWKFRRFLLPVYPDVLKAIKILNTCDAVVLNGVSVSLGFFIKKPTVAFLTGSDLLVYSTDSWINTESNNGIIFFKKIKSFLFERFRKRQCLSIEKAKVVIFPTVQPESNEYVLLHRINVLKKQLSLQYMPDNYFQYNPPSATGALRILYGARLNWKKPFPPGMVSMDCKGTDTFLQGIALLVEKHPDVKINLVLVKKGIHIRETAELIDELNLEEYVSWKDEMTQDEFFNECKLHDIIVDQIGSSVPGMVTVTAMALGKMAMTSIPLGKEYRCRFSGAVIDVSTSEEVCNSLYEIYLNEDLRISLSRTAHQRALNYFTPEVNAKRLLEVLCKEI